MTFAARTLGAGAGAFVPTTHTYATVGSGTETVPVGATKVVITNQGAGSAGYFNLSYNVGGGADGEGIKTIAVTGGNTLLFGVPGGSAANSNLAGGNATVSGTVSGGAVNMVARGGGPAGSGGVGGTSTGGDINTTGGSASGSGGGASPYGPTAGNGGQSYQAGQNGIIVFAYT